MSSLSQRFRHGAKLRRIALGDLLPRRNHPYRLNPRVRKALKEHIASGGLYPPLIVRPHSKRRGKFEILDGHQRADILAELGFADARCEVWAVGDGAAEVYSATLNHLRAHPIAKVRAGQLRRLIRRMGRERIGELLALTPAGMRQQLAILEPAGKLSETVRPLELQAVTPLPIVLLLRGWAV